MRKKGLLAIILAASLLLSGCSLALPEEDGKTDGDPMVGVLITTQPLDLFDSEAYLRENASSVLNGGMIRADDAAMRCFPRGMMRSKAMCFPIRRAMSGSARKRATKAATIPECRMTMCSATARAPFM